MPNKRIGLKITHGFVTQEYDLNTGEFLSQNFTCGDQCEWETGNGESIEEPENVEYQTYDMAQPK